MTTSRTPDLDALHQAKRPRSIVAGPYGHPFHSVAVTIPIGAWTASVVFDIVGFFSAEPASWAAGARVLIIIGLIGALGAAVLGVLDYSRIRRGTIAHRTALVHMVLNVAAMLLFAIGLALRLTEPDRSPVFAFVLSLIAMAGLSVSGWLGGELAFRWGVRVADETTQATGFAAR